MSLCASRSCTRSYAELASYTTRSWSLNSGSGVNTERVAIVLAVQKGSKLHPGGTKLFLQANPVVFQFVFVQLDAEAGLRGDKDVSIIERKRLRDDVILIIDSGDALLGFFFR